MGIKIVSKKRIEAYEQEIYELKAKMTEEHLCFENELRLEREFREQEINALKEKHAREVERILEQKKIDIKQAVEALLLKRENLHKSSEKDLMVNLTLSLGEYASTLAEFVQRFNVEEIADSISSVTFALSEQINHIDQNLQREIGKIQEEIENDIEKLRDFTQLGEIKEKVDEIAKNIGDEYSYDSLCYGLRQVKDSVEETKRVSEDVKERVGDKYSYDSLYYELSQLKDSVGESIKAAEETRRAAEEAKKAAEDAEDAAKEACEKIE